MSIIPMAVYGLSVEPHGIPIPAEGSIQGAFTITMAAIDPTETPEVQEGSSGPARATLKLIRQPLLDIDDDDSEASFDQDEMEALLAEGDSEDDDEESSDGDEDEKAADGMTKKERDAAVAQKLKAALEADGMEVDIPNGTKKAKAKAKANAADDEEDDEDEEEDEEDDDDESIEGEEEFVICTLDAEKNFQQPLNITIGADEEVYFKVDGNFTVHLTGNYVAPADDDYEDDEDDEDMYGMYPGAEDLDEGDSDESDELDDMEDPRVMEVSEDEVEVPVLIEAKKDKKSDKKAEKKGKNKRAAEDSADETPAAAETVDELIAKAGGEQKLSKKQLKKLKANDGKAVPVAAEGTPDKKVQFAEKLVQGPTKTGPTVVQGVTIDDKKVGEGKAAKNGSSVSMRYIGKLKNGKVFDSNKSGKPFTFKLGKGEVIKGWEVGIAGIKVGGERRITVPANMAYGSQKMPDIPPNSTLTFDVKCLEIK